MGDADRTRVRRVQMGFVYQFHQLLPEFSALENVVIPQMILGRTPPAVPRSAPRRCSARWVSPTASITAPRSCRAASSSAPPSPARWPTIRASSSPTSRPATSTRTPPSTCSTRCCISSTPPGVAALIATHNLELARRMDRVLRLEDGLLVEVAPAAVR